MIDESEDVFVERFREAGLFGGRSSSAEIDGLEARYGFRLPAAYRAFLCVAGRGGIKSLAGSDYTLARLPGLREGAIELLTGNASPFALPANAFVFLMHQGCFFEYFLYEDGVADPVTFYSQENREGPLAAAVPFSWWAKWKVDR